MRHQKYLAFDDVKVEDLKTSDNGLSFSDHNAVSAVISLLKP